MTMTCLTSATDVTLPGLSDEVVDAMLRTATFEPACSRPTASAKSLQDLFRGSRLSDLCLANGFRYGRIERTPLALIKLITIIVDDEALWQIRRLVHDQSPLPEPMESSGGDDEPLSDPRTILRRSPMRTL